VSVAPDSFNEAALPEPWGSVLAALESLASLGDARHAQHARAIDALTEQLDGLITVNQRQNEILRCLAERAASDD
jgi:hypothetical protein